MTEFLHNLFVVDTRFGTNTNGYYRTNQTTFLRENVFGLIKNMCWANSCDNLIGLLCITTPARTPVDEPVRTAQLLGLSVLHDSVLCASSDIATDVPRQVMPDAPPFEKTAL